MKFAVLLSAEILLAVGYAVATALSRTVRVPGGRPPPPRWGDRDPRHFHS